MKAIYTKRRHLYKVSSFCMLVIQIILVNIYIVLINIIYTTDISAPTLQQDEDTYSEHPQASSLLQMQHIHY